MSSMISRILVPVKRVVDYSIKVRANETRTNVDTRGLKMSLNPFDEVALEQAVKLHEQGRVEEIVAVTIGNTNCQEICRQALAFGAHRAIHVNTDPIDEYLEPLQIAKILKIIITQYEPSQLVIMGKQSIDDDYNQTGQILAALLNWPQATFLSKIEPSTDWQYLDLTREVDHGLETLRSSLPAVVTCDLRLNTPRFLSIQNIMKSRRKPIKSLTLQDLGFDELTPRLKTLKVEDPPARRGKCTRLSNAAELVQRLQHDQLLSI